MIRLYLDWNVINGMRTSKEGDEFFVLKNYLEENRSYFEVYYSHAHLSDLAGHKKVLDDEIKADLAFLSHLTENRAFSIRDGEVHFGKSSPLDWYKTLIDDDILDDAKTLEDLFETIGDDDPTLSKIVSQQVELLKSIPIPEEMRQLPFLFPERTGKTLYDASNAMLRMSKDWMDTDAYGKVRDFLKQILNSDPNRISSAQNPFAAIDSNFRALGPESSYANVENSVNSSSKEHMKSCPDWYNKVSSTFLSLDMHGYSSDQIKINDQRKQTFHNTANDSAHAAYASLCHIYIIADRKARRKTVATYERLGINTVILAPNAEKDQRYASFINGDFLRNPDTAQSLFDSVMQTLTSGKLADEDANNGEQRILVQYPFCSYYGFFNKIIVIPGQDSFQVVLGTREPTNWPNLFIDATVNLANRLISIFGQADDGTETVDVSNLQEIQTSSDSKWSLIWGNSLYLVCFAGRVQFYFPPVPLKALQEKRTKPTGTNA